MYPVLDQDCINFTLTVPSLEHITIVNIVTKLWKQPDLRKKIRNHVIKCYRRRKFDDFRRNESFDRLSKVVLEKLSLLGLPKSLEKKGRNVIRFIGKEIMNWIHNFETESNWHNCNSKLECLDYLCCTMIGTIDKAKTLELILMNKKTYYHIFRRACECCLEEHIIDSWNKIPRETQTHLCKSIFQGYSNHLIAYWICFAKSELSQFISMIKQEDFKNIYNCNHSIYKNMFTLSVSEGKALAAKYFWQKLTDEERNNNKLEWLYLAIEEKKRDETNNEYTDIMCFLLSQMDDGYQQKEIFREHSEVVLKSLFWDYPSQRFLIPAIQLMWDFLDSNVYVELLIRIIKEVEKDGTNGNFFIELWCNSPIRFKRYFIQHINLQDLLHLLKILFEIENAETVRFILKDCNVEEKNWIISSSLESGLLFKFIYTEKFASVDTLIRECSMSEGEIKDVKEYIILKDGTMLCCDWLFDGNFQGIEKFFNWCFTEHQLNIFKAMIVNIIKVENSLDTIGHIFLNTFESFINWCFNSNEEMGEFEMVISYPHDMYGCVTFDIVVNKYFEFVKKFLVWCFPSKEELYRLKKKMFFSGKGVNMFSRVLIYCNEDYNKENNPFECIVKLTHWFRPFERAELTEFKEKLREKYCDRLFNRDTKILTDFFDLLTCFCWEDYWFEKRFSNSFLFLKRNLIEDESYDENRDDDDESYDCSSSSSIGSSSCNSYSSDTDLDDRCASMPLHRYNSMF